MKCALSFSVKPDGDFYNFCMSKYRELEKEVRSEKYMSMNPKERGQEILSLIYDKCLSLYVENQTKLDVLFEKGSYNCVSSSVLYACLAREAGLEVIPQKTPDHAFITLAFSDGSKIDVETTNPYGFNPGTKKKLAENGNVTRYAIIPAKKYQGRHAISERMLVSLVGGNLAVLNMERGRYGSALALQAARLLLVEDENKNEVSEVRNDFDITCSNYASDLQRKKLFQESVLWFEKVQSSWGNTPYIQERYETACHNYLSSLLNEKKFSEAESFISERKTKLPASVLEPFEGNMLMLSLQEEIKASSNDQALLLLREALENPLLKNDRQYLTQIASWQAYFWTLKIDECEKEEGFVKAMELMEEALSEVKGNRDLLKLKSNMQYNHAVQVHNKFASLANQGKTQEALKILEKGLEENPGNKVLESDLRRIKKQTGR